MQDKTLSEQILGLSEPWFVERVELDVTEQRVTLFVEHRAAATWACPHGSQAAPLYDHSPVRTWRHLDTCQFRTHVQARPPRVECDEHGVCTVKLPWAQPGGTWGPGKGDAPGHLLFRALGVGGLSVVGRCRQPVARRGTGSAGPRGWLTAIGNRQSRRYDRRGCGVQAGVDLPDRYRSVLAS